jgi:hypothetical protein
VISVVLTLFVDADTIGIANRLWINPVLRQEIASRAEKSLAQLKDLVTAEYKDPSNPKPSKADVKTPANPEFATVRQVHSQLEDLTGWYSDWHQAAGDIGAFATLILFHIPGWILTIIAVSLGAPFWFDTLNRFINIRAAGKSPVETDKGPKKSS